MPTEGSFYNISFFLLKDNLQNNKNNSNREFRDGKNCQVRSHSDQRDLFNQKADAVYVVWG